MLRAAQYESPDPKEGQWRFLALVIQPDGLYLREFDGEDVEELGKAEVAIPHGQWHTVTIEFGGPQGGSQYDGDSVVVKQLLNGAEAAERIEATTSIPGGGNVGFGVGSDANFRFDNVGTRQDFTLTATAALRYHYDVNGRVVGRTLNPGEVDEESHFFIYDGDRIIQELNGEGDLVVAWDYGVYIDELLAMHRDTDDDGILDTTYYYLQDDLYNVVGLVDASGAVVERYAYDDYGAPTIYSGDGATTRTESAYDNPFLFQGRRWDEFLELYDYRTRYYDPAIGRFLRIDTIGLWGDGNNLGNPYAFVGNNPWSNLDPFGESAIGKVLRAAVQEGSEVGIKNKVRQEIKEGWYGHLQRQISKSGLKGMYEGHHILAQALFKDPALAKWFDEIGVLQHEAKNVTALPTKEAAKSGMDIGSASLHRGGPIPSYTADIKVRLYEKMKENLPSDEALKAVRQIQAETRAKLQSGQIKLQRYDTSENRQEWLRKSTSGMMALCVWTGMSEADAVEITMESITESVENETYYRQKNVFVRYGTAGYYTQDSNSAVAGWAAFAVDFFNPVEDVIFVTDMMEDGGRALVNGAAEVSDMLDEAGQNYQRATTNPNSYLRQRQSMLDGF